MPIADVGPFPVENGGDLAARLIEQEVARTVVAMDHAGPVERGDIARQPVGRNIHQREFLATVFLPNAQRPVDPQLRAFRAADRRAAERFEAGMLVVEGVDPRQVVDELRRQQFAQARAEVSADAGDAATDHRRRLGDAMGVRVDQGGFGKPLPIRVYPISPGHRDDSMQRPQQFELAQPARRVDRFRRLHAHDQVGSRRPHRRLVPAQGQAHLQLRGPSGEPALV